MNNEIDSLRGAIDYSLALLPFAAICFISIVGFVVLYARHRIKRK